MQVRVANSLERPEVVGLRLEARDDALLANVVVTSERLRSLPLRQIREAAFATYRLDFPVAFQAIGKVERTGKQPWPTSTSPRSPRSTAGRWWSVAPR